MPPTGPLDRAFQGYQPLINKAYVLTLVFSTGDYRLRVQAGVITCRFLAAAATAVLVLIAQAPSVRAGDDRTISFYHIHTKETLTVLYKKNGRFVPDALEKINWILRDWRVNKATKMDPNTVDIIWEMHRELGSQQPVHIISGYRSPATNEMLRKTRGGQAKQSQHMTGKAIDIHFPDVPLRRMRYSAMIRERGGVGYYPTSGIPFVHVDTARVRHWPRMPRDELAILFPSGRSKHGSVSPAEVRAARARRKDLVQEVAQFMDLHNGKRPAVQVATATMPTPKVVAQLPTPPKPTPATRPPALHARMTVGGPEPRPQDLAQRQAGVSLAALAPAPKAKRTNVALTRAEPTPTPPQPTLISPPRALDRPSKFVMRPAESDKNRLDMLVTLASIDPAPPVAAPAPPPVTAMAPAATAPASTPSATQPARLVTGSTPMRAAMLPDLSLRPKRKPLTAEVPVTEPAATAPAAAIPDLASAHPFGAEGSSDWRSGWLAAPEYDEDHPDEISYRPFALAPLLTETPSFDDPALQTLVHPDSDMALAMLDDEGLALPMRFGAGHTQTAMAWAQEFRGSPVDLDGLALAAAAVPATSTTAAADANASARQLVSRAVRTLPR